MTISNTTPAGGPTNVVNSEQAALQLFGPGSTSNTSQEFTVDQHPFVLSSYNLGSDDVVLVEQIVFQGASKMVSRYQPVYGPVQLDANRSKAIIEMPGRYRVRHSGSSSLGTFTVLGAPYSSTGTGIAELAAGLQAVIANVNITVIGTSPVVVTGAGTPVSPYDVTTPDITVQAVTPFQIAVGHSASASTGAVAVGKSASAAGGYAIAIGIAANAPTTGSVAIGQGAMTSGTTGASISIGNNSLSHGFKSVTVGPDASGAGDSSVTIGDTASGTAAHSVAVGSNTHGSGISGVAVGDSANDAGDYGVAIGYQTAADVGAVAIGKSANTSGASPIAIGNGAAAVSDYEIAIGANAGNTDTHTGTIIIASKSTTTNATQNNQIILGTSTQTQLVTAGSVIQGGVISASDERLKKNLQLEENVVEQLNKLDPVTFEWDRTAVEAANGVMNEEEYNKKQHGLIAQEVQEVFPEIVATVDRGTGPYLYVHYDRLVSLLIAAVQELDSRLSTLEGK